MVGEIHETNNGTYESRILVMTPVRKNNDMDIKCSLKVAQWPEWKRNVRVTKYSGLNAEQRKHLNDCEDRERLSKGDYSWWPK